jgi:hypothetical protein
MYHPFALLRITNTAPLICQLQPFFGDLFKNNSHSNIKLILPIRDIRIYRHRIRHILHIPIFVDQTPRLLLLLLQSLRVLSGRRRW